MCKSVLWRTIQRATFRNLCTSRYIPYTDGKRILTCATLYPLMVVGSSWRKTFIAKISYNDVWLGHFRILVLDAPPTLAESCYPSWACIDRIANELARGKGDRRAGVAKDRGVAGRKHAVYAVQFQALPGWKCSPQKRSSFSGPRDHDILPWSLAQTPEKTDVECPAQTVPELTLFASRLPRSCSARQVLHLLDLRRHLERFPPGGFRVRSLKVR